MPTKFQITLLLLFSFLTAFSQKLPYPIILVHGLTSSDDTWLPTLEYYKSTGLSLNIDYNRKGAGYGTRIEFCLNADGNKYVSYLYNDVYDYNSYVDPSGDVFVINFQTCHNSNQSAIVKQGYALGIAIRKVLRATGADKVILFGHSMGGLAIREYLQNSSHWPDSYHHVAKSISSGTPHGGSDQTGLGLGVFIGLEELSEAVRDLRSTYYTGSKGLYLFGGYENVTFVRGLGQNFHNLDANCNGREGDYITGLNSKNLPGEPEYTCIVGTSWGTSDGVVTTTSQNLNNFYKYTNGKQLARTVFSQTSHGNLTGLSYINFQTIDEPEDNEKAFEVALGKTYKGYFTNQLTGSYADTDRFKIYLNQRGVVTVQASVHQESNANVEIVDSYGYALKSQSSSGTVLNTSTIIDSPGTYYISFTGSSTGGWAQYFYSLNFCSLPSAPVITSSGNTTFCEGQSISLTTNAAFDEYKWYRNGQLMDGRGNEIMVTQGGEYKVQGIKCGIITASVSGISIIVNPVPSKPTITKQDLPDSFVLTSSSAEDNQWYLDDNPIKEATTQSYSPQVAGNYQVKVSRNGCDIYSEHIFIGVEKPTLTVVGSSTLCEGDSVRLVAPVGFGTYVFSNGQNEISQKENSLTTRRGGFYTVITQRGPFKSPSSDPVQIVVNPMPSKPIITLEGYSLKSSSPTNNQWYLNGSVLVESTRQYIGNFGAGTYVVRITELGCYAESDPFLITSISLQDTNLPINIYPNPSSGQFWINIPFFSKNLQIEIVDKSGTSYYNSQVDMTTNPIFIQANVPAGLYILKIEAPNFSRHMKLIFR